MMAWDELPRSPGHAFYDELQRLLFEADFDAFVEELCKPHYAATMGARSIPPRRYFRMIALVELFSIVEFFMTHA